MVVRCLQEGPEEEDPREEDGVRLEVQDCQEDPSQDAVMGVGDGVTTV